MTESVKPGKRPPCTTCGQPGFYLCDYPVKQAGGLPHKSCNRVMCRKHATTIAGLAHYCPPHERASHVQVKPPEDRPRVPGFED